MEWINITRKVQNVVDRSSIKNGIVFVNSLHNTAALTIQEDESSIHKDVNKILDRIAPLNEKYTHDEEGSENATAHIKSNLLGSFLTLPLKDGNLVLGTWQQIFFIELFEPRQREVVVTVIGE